MAEAAGKAGLVKEGSNTIAGMKEWHLDYVANTGETTDFESSGHKEFIICLDEWSGTFAGSLDGTPLTLGTKYTLNLQLTAALKYSGSAFITGVHPGITVDGVNVLSYDFQGTAGLTYGGV